ncbi:MAG: non-ribosomal peptide synthetase [Verrucomicrobiales bacterium]
MFSSNQAAEKSASRHRLTLPQESLWCLESFVPNSPIYNIPFGFRIKGCIDCGALQRAFDSALERQTAFRSKLIQENGQTWQVVSETPLTIRHHDCSHLTGSDLEEEVASALDAEVNTAFNLREELPVRALLLRLSAQEHVLCITMHHLFSDHSSLHLLCREVSEFYRAEFSHNSPDLPELETSFGAWAEQERALSEEDQNEDDFDYWKEKLSGKLTRLDLPTDFPRSNHIDFEGATIPLAWSAEFSERIKNFSQAEGVSIFNTLLAAFNVLVYRYTGENDIILGAPIGQRNSPELQNLAGFFVQTLPLRSNLGGNPTFRELLERTGSEIFEALDHQNLHIEKLMESLRLPREQAQHPLHQVVFQYLPSGDIHLDLQNASVESFPLFTRTSKFDLTFSLYTTTDGIRGEIEYRTRLFQPETIRRMMGHFATLVDHAVSHPDQQIGAIPMLTENERNQLLVEWNRTETNYPREATLDQLFQQVVAQYQNNTALVLGNTELSYAQLNAEAEALAAKLAANGVKQGSYVGIGYPRSIEMIVAVLATIKLGAVYVPLDPKYPLTRLSSLIEESRVQAVLASTSSQLNFPAAVQKVIYEYSGKPSATGAPRAAAANPTSPAYVLFTSGSTGKPKGVVVPHRAIMRLVRDTTFASFGPEEVFLQFAPLSFDASTLEIWGPLLNGGKLVLAPAEVESLDQLGELISRNKVTTLWLTSGVFHYMVDNHLQALAGVKQLLAGGDVLSVQHVLRAQKALAGCRIINGYGPTENTTFTCCHTIPGNWTGGRSVPIGRPISNTTVYILDDRMQPVPIGVPGELYTGGDGLALGYINDAALTSERFVPNPFSSEDSRLYRTGDLARRLSDGSIEFLGRRDQQVKIRGFRIELEEIETTLRQCSQVKDCVVTAKADAHGSNFLIAYVVPKGQGNASEIRREMEGKAPSFLVPSKFVFLPQLPVTTNGKVDRKALPEATEENSSAPAASNLSPVEEKLRQIWRELLKVENIQAEDDFFELGGHSLLAMRIVSRINNDFGSKLTMKHLFEAPRISALARHLSVVPEKPASRTADAPIKRRSAVAGNLTNKLNNLSEQDVDALLKQMSGQTNSKP